MQFTVVANESNRELRWQKYNTDYFSQLLPYLDSISEEDAACTIQTLEKFYAIMRERKDSLEKR